MITTKIADWWRSTSKSKKLALVLAVVFVAVMLRGVWMPKSSGAGVQTVERGVVEDVVKLTGTVVVGGKNEVVSPATGYLESVYVTNGQTVKEGDPLFKVKSTAKEQDKANAWSAYATAQANLKTAEQNKYTNQATLEIARKAVLDAQVAVDRMEANIIANKANSVTGLGYTQIDKDAVNSTLTSARQTFSYAEKKYVETDQAIAAALAARTAAWYGYQAVTSGVVKASSGGTIVNFLKGVGDEVKAAAGSKPVLVIAHLDSLAVDVRVSEMSIPKIAAGQKVEMVFDALKGSKFMGKVDRVDVVGSEENGITSFGARVVFDDSAKALEQLRPSLTADVTIIAQRKEGALRVPRSSVRFDNGDTLVMMADGKERKVVPGLIGTTMMEVESGVNEGEKVKTNVK
ncbi:hypothetical protein A2368_03440 [Candidatus Collierbacteria bacterium RIFOXYB1_FULL_49_13]|uniref:Lipoyl-binding domain-containing protein n=1 Tax=Candidatus Collierbacteria bacterium RIFOXYB1_FULL_49_13 TaxID=1817728 RepID=A0A1F5FIJ6_9BACT|nr:MAG: hypothetical protein A2368_03440 [Candidatus Collierbacteria bacterium RIFOXYB1_FULL_49_13]